MNTFKKKILLAGMVAVFAFITTIGATYAWFTIGQSSAVTNITLNIQSATSLMILMDDGYVYDAGADKAFLDNPGNYVTLLTNAAILDKYVFSNIVFEPTTTQNGTSWIKQDLITTASYSDSAVTPGQYMEFSVWILSQDKAVSVTVMDFLAESDPSNTPQQAVIVDAIRLSVTGDAGTGKIYGQDKDYDYVYSDLSAINGTIKTTLIGLHGLYYGSLVADQSTDVLADAPTILTLAANVPEKITLRIWIEGWDYDCNNNALDSIFSLTFGFIVKEVL